MQKLPENNGLPVGFQLEGGRFQMLTGTAKVDDNISVLMNFIGWFRIFGQDFVLNPYIFFQNSSNYLLQYKGDFRLQALSIGQRYIKGAEFTAVDIPVEITNRKTVTLYMQYRYNLKGTDDKVKTVKKVIL